MLKFKSLMTQHTVSVKRQKTESLTGSWQQSPALKEILAKRQENLANMLAELERNSQKSRSE